MKHCRNIPDLLHSLPLDFQKSSVGQLIKHDQGIVKFIRGAILLIVHRLLIAQRFQKLVRLLLILNNKLDLLAVQDAAFVLPGAFVGQPGLCIVSETQDTSGGGQAAIRQVEAKIGLEYRGWTRGACSSSRRAIIRSKRAT